MTHANTNKKPRFDVGMIVDCRTTYRNFQGRIVKACGTMLYHPGDSYIVESFADGQEYRVSEFSMKPVADEAEPHEDRPISDLGQSLIDMMVAINTAGCMQHHFEAMARLDRKLTGAA